MENVGFFIEKRSGWDAHYTLWRVSYDATRCMFVFGSCDGSGYAGDVSSDEFARQIVSGELRRI